MNEKKFGDVLWLVGVVIVAGLVTAFAWSAVLTNIHRDERIKVERIHACREVENTLACLAQI